MIVRNGNEARNGGVVLDAKARHDRLQVSDLKTKRMTSGDYSRLRNNKPTLTTYLDQGRTRYFVNGSEVSQSEFSAEQTIGSKT